jgi:hypothetical protein
LAMAASPEWPAAAPLPSVVVALLWIEQPSQRGALLPPSSLPYAALGLG